jgi:hypothetical protein
MANKCAVTLPDFSLLKRQPKVPHVARVVARRDIPNQYGTPITYTVQRSRNGKSWWISASREGFRMSGTIHTTKAEKAQQWIDAVQRGRACIKER